MDVDVTELRGAAADVSAAADDISACWDELLAGDRPAFGADPVSSLIGLSYGLAEQWAGESFGSAVEVLRSVASGLVAMAETYALAEREITASFRATEER